MRRLARTNRTLVVVCEGHAEVQMIRVIRGYFLDRDSGVSLQSVNAYGFGGKHTLRRAIELRRQRGYDGYAVMVDTDAHWDKDDRASAARLGITCIENHPCIEATLLALGIKRTFARTAENKAEFLHQYGDQAHRDFVIQRNFTREMFEAGRTRVAPVQCLLNFIGR
jgi:hypothetical protein